MLMEIDALIIGAGPVGLFQAFQLGLQDVRTHIVDTLPQAGGQCITLYADKPIYDIPGIAVCTGRELTERLLAQVSPFAQQFHFNQLVTELQALPDGRYRVRTETVAGTPAPANASAANATAITGTTEFVCKTIFVAAGVGAFQPRKLGIEGVAPFEGSHVHYSFDTSPGTPDTNQRTGQHLVVCGDGNQALEAALSLSAANAVLPAHHRAHISLLHRRDAFSADEATVTRFRQALASGELHFVAGQITSLQGEGTQLKALDVLRADGSNTPQPCDQLWVLQGLSPKLGPVAGWGLALERRQLVVNTETFATSLPGIFAVGDINTYPGKKKLILCGFHECVLAAFGAMPILRPTEKALLQYTTTSSKLHRLLGVEHPHPQQNAI